MTEVYVVYARNGENFHAVLSLGVFIEMENAWEAARDRQRVADENETGYTFSVERIPVADRVEV